MTAAKQLGLDGRDERPSYRLHETARGEHAPPQPLPFLRFRQHRPRHAARPLHGRGGHAIHAHEPHHLLYEVGGAGDVRAPGRGRRLEFGPFALECDAERPQKALDLGGGQVEPAQSLDQARVEGERRIGFGRLAGHLDLAGAPAAQIEHQRRGQLKPRHHEIRIDAALESHPRVGLNVELPPRARCALRVEISGLDEDVGGGGRRPRLLAAHHAAEAQDVGFIGDDATYPHPPHRSCRRARRRTHPRARAARGLRPSTCRRHRRARGGRRRKQYSL